ncbi:MAG: bifunctional uridylyltransferase/uridylyl-removing protein, partial [Phenylobacterium sp.]|nr:bifunctional uridylyltransferase/uridylyl-removing protein [Phenylobacterium sp.]
DNEASETATVVEASGRDRTGLLAGLARTLSDAGLLITSAHIDGYGERAVDAFYVVDAQGQKLTDARKRNALRAALLSTLNDSEADPGERRTLQRARASVAR